MVEMGGTNMKTKRHSDKMLINLFYLTVLEQFHIII